MADDDDQENLEAEDGEKQPKKGKGKLFLIIGVVVVLLGGGGAGAYFMGLFGATPEGEMAKEEAPPPPPPAVYYPMDEMTVNLASTNGRATYIKMDVALEVESEDIFESIDAAKPRILDTFNTYLRELRVSDLEGSAGMFRLKKELQHRINIAIYPSKINAVRFKSILIQ